MTSKFENFDFQRDCQPWWLKLNGERSDIDIGCSTLGVRCSMFNLFMVFDVQKVIVNR